MSNTEPTTPAAAPADMTVLRGGDDFAVKTNAGVDLTVFIRLLPVVEMKRYLALYDDFAEMCAFVVGWEIDKINTLTEDSLYALYRRITEINDPRFDRWLKQRDAAVEKFKALRSPTS